MTSTAAALLMDRLGLDEEDLCTILAVDPLALITGELDHRPELPILMALTGEAAEKVHPEAFKRWLRTAGPSGRPLDHLLARDFGAFEDTLETLSARGFVVRASGPGGPAA